MNLVLLGPDEVSEDGVSVLRDERARHIHSVLGATVGSEIRVGQLEGPVGKARVLSSDAREVRLRCRFEGTPPARPRVDLLLALPRPKVLSRLWAPLAALGVGRVVVTNAARVERCYFDSRAVLPEVYRPRLIEGLAQARDTRLPEVRVEKRLKVFVEDGLDRLVGDARRLLADPTYGRSPYQVARGTPENRRLLLALGPEGGWTPYERDLFERHGFVGVGLGPRTLRSDTAAVALLALVHDALRARG